MTTDERSPEVYLTGKPPKAPSPPPTEEQKARWAQLRAPFEAIEAWRWQREETRIVSDALEQLRNLRDRYQHRPDEDQRALASRIDLICELLTPIESGMKELDIEAWRAIQNTIEPLQNREAGE